MMFTMVVYVGVFLTACLFGALVVPRFDRSPSVNPAAAPLR